MSALEALQAFIASYPAGTFVVAYLGIVLPFLAFLLLEPWSRR